MGTIETIIWLLLFRSAYSAYQCYQCAHNENYEDLDCVNADLKYLLNCTDDNPAITDWSCKQVFNFTTTVLYSVSRECIPRVFLTECVSTGGFYDTFQTCICETDACNNAVKIRNGTTTTVQPTTDPDNGSANLRFSSILVVCYFVVFSLICVFQ